MRIELASLEEGRGEFSHDYAPDELVIDDDRLRVTQPPTVSGRISRDGRIVKVSGKLATRVQLECDRCLKPIELPVESNFKLEYASTEEYRAQQAVELSEDDMNLVIFEGDAIDVDELVKDEIFLAVPEHTLCREDCKGLCPVCGVNRNSVDCNCKTTEVDPRWSGLKELVNGKS
ncbi:MAG TPA: DUF177 domain-containing protein [Pyrinomonadaceae bacterium]|nr:DUF177 domain-containing protein [Pyrinomonadaceae bacterium]